MSKVFFVYSSTVLKDKSRFIDVLLAKDIKEILVTDGTDSTSMSSQFYNLVRTGGRSKTAESQVKVIDSEEGLRIELKEEEGLDQQKIDALNNILSHMGLAPLHKQQRFYREYTNNSSHQSTHQQDSTFHYRTPPNALDHAYAILEIDSTKSKQEIKKAYQRLMSRNHPDKLIAQGLPEEMIKLANEKTQNIRKAYEQICTSKGW